MIEWIISLLKGEKKTASELVKDIVKRLEIELKDTSDFSSQMEKLELLFGDPYTTIKKLAEDETIDDSKTPKFNKYFGGISDILATILWLIKKIRKNNEAISLELKELSRLDKGNIRVHNNHYQITSNFEEYLKKILVVMFSEMQKMAIEGNIAGKSYKYGELVENLEKLHEDFNSLSDRIAYTKKMLQENKAVLEEIVNRYRVNLEAKGSYVSPSLVRWILVTLFSIGPALGCGSVPKVENKVFEPPAAVQPTATIRAYQKEIRLPPYPDSIYAFVGEDLNRDLNGILKFYYKKYPELSGAKELYTTRPFVEESNNRLGEGPLEMFFFRINDGKLHYIPPSEMAGKSRPLQIVIIIRDADNPIKKYFTLELTLKMINKINLPPGTNPEEIG